MRSVYSILILAAIALIGTQACQKTKNTNNTGVLSDASSSMPASAPPSYGGNGSGLNKLFRELRYRPETKCITAGKLQTITFGKGTRLTFYPNSFKDGAGRTITSGTVCLEVIEMPKPGDMIANRATTISAGNTILTSGGQVHIKATKGGETVYARKYGIAFKQAASSMQPMALYYGNTNNTDSLVIWGGSSSVTGAFEPGTTDTLPPPPGDTTGGYGLGFWYQFDSCTDFNWINCDYFYATTAAKTQVKVIVADTGANGSNTQVFMAIPAINAALPLYYQSGAPLTYKTADIPEGLTASVVVIMKKNMQYYYSETLAFLITTQFNIVAYPMPQTIGYIQGRLAAL
ncbi:hypothetical protein GCM10023093_21420 [Nemorincola caseinilytica]|uniref:Uncharacterized protein n=1 Tax=Nemorincola caseinilytica TaxID=2054315 RepID=A0ABP8NGC5_9BACT